jgi:tripartite-type tricarboxylate transporter receptor subunit TctC
MMKLRRRTFLHLVAGAAALPALSQFARAQSYPTRPVRIVVGLPAGLTPDIVARLVGQRLSERLGQPVVVESRPGAGGNIATEVVVRAPPDGYTLLLTIASDAFNATLYSNLPFNYVGDVAPVAMICTTPFIMVVNPSVPAKTVPEFIAHAKANPGKINMASSGIGTAPHLFGELFKMMTGVDLVHVPYRGNSMSDLLAGQVQVTFTGVASAIEYVRAGKLRALAVTTAARVEVLPEIPPVGDFVSGYEASGWNGIIAPKSTPTEIVEKLNNEINAVVADPSIKARLAGLGVIPMSMTPAQFGKLIANETEKWAKVVKFANIKPG